MCSRATFPGVFLFNLRSYLFLLAGYALVETFILRTCSFVSEGRGSLLFFLKCRGWAISLSAGVGDEGMHRSSLAYIFGMSINLTDSGLEKVLSQSQQSIYSESAKTAAFFLSPNCGFLFMAYEKLVS